MSTVALAEFQRAREQGRVLERLVGSASTSQVGDSNAFYEFNTQALSVLDFIRGESGLFIQRLEADVTSLLAETKKLQTGLRENEESRQQAVNLLLGVGKLDRVPFPTGERSQQSTSVEDQLDIAEKLHSILKRLELSNASWQQFILEKRKLLSDVMWPTMCGILETDLAWAEDMKGLFTRLPHGRHAQAVQLTRDIIVELEQLTDRLVDLMRQVLISVPEWQLDVPVQLTSKVWTVQVSPSAYLWAMWNLFWSAIRYPFSETTIDLGTGQILYRT